MDLEYYVLFCFVLAYLGGEGISCKKACIGEFNRRSMLDSCIEEGIQVMPSFGRFQRVKLCYVFVALSSRSLTKANHPSNKEIVVEMMRTLNTNPSSIPSAPI